MRGSQQQRWRILCLTFTLGIFCIAGCAAIQPRRVYRIEVSEEKQPTPKSERPNEIIPVAQLSFAPARMSLTDLIDLAAEHHPELASARAKIDAARGQHLQAGLYPNPIIAPEIDNVGSRRDALGEPGVQFTQQIVTGHKLKIARAAAAQGVSAADWAANSQWFAVVARVRSAYYELAAAQRELAAARKITNIAKQSLTAAKTLLKAKVGNQPDVLRAQVELDQAEMTVAVAEQRVFAAAKTLAASVGSPELPCHAQVDEAVAILPFTRWGELIQHMLDHSSEIQEAEARAMQAEHLLRRAEVEKIPNILLEMRPTYFFPEQRALFFTRAGVAVPIFNANQGNIQTAAANLAVAHADVDAIKLRLTQQLAAAHRNYQAALKQTRAYKDRMLPNAEKSVELVQLGYKNGDPKYDYTALLQVQKTLFQAELDYVRSLGQMWQAAAEIDRLIQRPSTATVCHSRR